MYLSIYLGYFAGSAALSTGEIVGIVVTLILLVLVIAALILLIIQRGLPDKIKGWHFFIFFQVAQLLYV